jgi:cobaltochelatase CobT
VVRSRVQAESFDTVVSMYVDHSGSMFPYKMDLAAECAVIFGECLHDLSIPFEICGFSTMPYHIGNGRWQQATDEERRLFTRWGDLWIGVYKQFEDNWPTSRHRCVEMSRNDHDNTYDGESLRFAAQRLMRREEKRKILFWLNDGYPCPNVHQVRQQHHSYLKGVAKEVEKLVEVFAIGMQSDGVGEYFKNWVEVNELSDLSKVVVSELDRLLRINKRRVA